MPRHDEATLHLCGRPIVLAADRNLARASGGWGRVRAPKWSVNLVSWRFRSYMTCGRRPVLQGGRNDGKMRRKDDLS